MSKMLILMRHGKAQRPVEGQSDFERELTEAGRRSLEAMLPDLLALMPRDVPVQVWSSPAERAMQTARNMHRCCKERGIDVAPGVEPVEALWDQDASAFLAAVRACKAGAVVAVGHNPFIEDLTGRLTASHIDFATGGFAAIALAEGQCAGKDNAEAEAGAAAEAATAAGVAGAATAGVAAAGAGAAGAELVGASSDGVAGAAAAEAGVAPVGGAEAEVAVAVEDKVATAGGVGSEAAAEARVEAETAVGAAGEFEPAGRLLWFAQGPVSQRWRTLVRLERTLKAGADTVVQRLDGFFENPEDIETAHKLRVSIRTLRSLVAFVSPWQKRDQNKAVQADLKAIVACTSRLRELDVFSEQAEELEGAAPEFIAFCREKAAGERRCVLEALASKKMLKRLERVCDELGSVQWRTRVYAEGLGADEVRARFDGLTAQLEGDLAALDLADAEATHDVRKRAKQVRYDAEKFEQLLGDDAVGIAKGMTAHDS